MCLQSSTHTELITRCEGRAGALGLPLQMVLVFADGGQAAAPLLLGRFPCLRVAPASAPLAGMRNASAGTHVPASTGVLSESCLLFGCFE